MNIQQLYGKGARAFWIHNTGPIGCLPVIYAKNLDPPPGSLDEVGCAKDQNAIAIEFNKQLRAKVIQLRSDLPKAILIYVDMYSAKYELISNAKDLGVSLGAQFVIKVILSITIFVFVNHV